MMAKHGPGAQPAGNPPVTTDSGIPVASVYTAQDVAGGPDALAARLGRPGGPPDPARKRRQNEALARRAGRETVVALRHYVARPVGPARRGGEGSTIGAGR